MYFFDALFHYADCACVMATDAMLHSVPRCTELATFDIYQYSNIHACATKRLSGQTSIFDVILFVSKPLLGTKGQKSTI